MTNERDFDRIARAFMAEGTTQLADRVLERSLADVHHTRQRRALLRAPWRTPVMNIYAKLAAAAVVVVAVGALGVWFLSPGSSSAPVGGPPAESASPAAPPPSSASPEPSQTTSPPPTTPPLSGNFTSTRHGISLATPAEWIAQGCSLPEYEATRVSKLSRRHPRDGGRPWPELRRTTFGHTRAGRSNRRAGSCIPGHCW